MNNESIKKFEHSTLRIGEQGFDQDHFNKLVYFNDQHQSKYFTVGHKKIKFNSYVGVLQVGELVIEVLPKGDKTDNDNKWRNALIQMLRVARYLKLEVSERSLLKSSKNHLLELLFRSYLEEVTYLIRTGLVKKYITDSKNSKALKGKLLFNKNLQHNLVHKERFYNEFDFYSSDNLYNQVLKLALKKITQITSSIEISSIAKGLLLDMDKVSDLSPRGINFNQLILDRKTRDYDDALTLARMIIKNHSSDLQQGGLPLIAFLFDMNTLFEDFIYRSFKREEKNFKSIELKVKGQTRSKFWHYKEIRPDIILEFKRDGIPQKIIIDTKWKLLTELKPSDADLKQIYVYNMQLGAERGILLYPHSGLEPINKVYRKSRLIENEKLVKGYSHSCSLAFVDPFDEQGRIRGGFAGSFLRRLIELDVKEL